MALTRSYDSTLSRIQLSATLLGASATYAVFDRTTDFVNYTTIRGGSHVDVVSQNATIDDFEFPAGVLTEFRVRSYNSSDVLQQTFTSSGTQDLTDVWFKSVSQAFLNQSHKITDVGDISRPSRAGIFDIIGRSLPVVVSDVRGSKRINLRVHAVTDAKRDDFDYFLASGDPVFVHVPSTNIFVQGGYYYIENSSEVLVGIPQPNRFFNITLTEIATPTDDIVPVTYTWQGLKNDYSTWDDVIADNATWNAVLANTGDPEDVIIT